MSSPTLTPDHADIHYGQSHLRLQMDSQAAEWTVISPQSAAPLADARRWLRRTCESPIGSRPLREVVRPGDRVLIITSDGTRPVPNRRLLPWLLRELGRQPEEVTVLLGNGSHRANTPEEIAAMFGADLAARLQVVNHDAFDPRQQEEIGRTTEGHRAAVNRLYTQADKRIALGFIEPHFFAGFSGGAKAIVPGIASIETIIDVHSFALMAHPMSTFGTVEDNPVRQEVERLVQSCPPDFLVNVTLNPAKAITGIYCGDYVQAHRAGCEQARREAMQPVARRFPLTITSNSGFPLDQNLYQTIKGIAAAARITAPGGTIVIASECADGLPDHGNFGPLMQAGSSAADILKHIESLPAPVLDQWEAQLFAYPMMRYEIQLVSSMTPALVRACKLTPAADLQATVDACIAKLGGRPAVAVLPAGPLTIPYVVGNHAQ